MTRMPAKTRRVAALVAALLGLILVASAATWSAGLWARAADAEIVRATLPNGLRVIIVRNTLAPVVATSVNYLAGSDEAPPGFPGTAHAQEHMMFRGSPGLSADQLAHIGSIMGGNFNANTRESLTQYLFTVPSEDLDIALHIEAVRMQGALDTKEDWDKERGAIEQEVAQDLSNPNYLLYEKLRAVLFAGSPYEHDALGTRPSFEKTTAEMLKTFGDTWYAPNNALLVVVGNLNPSATLTKVRALFGPLKAKPLPPRPTHVFQPVQPATFVENTDRPNGLMMLAMRLPGLDSPDFPALEVLSDVLGSQRFDLYGLVPQGKAIDAGFALDPLPKASMGYAAVAFTAADDPKAIEAEVRAILAKVARDGVPADLVAAAKLQERRQAEFHKNSIENLASVWADAVALYGLNAPEDDLARIEKVTVADVNRVAKKYLDIDHAVVAVTLPKESGRPVATGAGFGGQEQIALGEAVPTVLPDWAQAALSRLSVPPSTTHPVVSTLPNGITLIVQPEDVSDTVSVFGHITNRPEVEQPPGKEGVAQILDELFDYGSERLDRIAFQEALDEIGAQEDAGTDFSVRVLARDFDRGVQLLADNQLRPALPKEAADIITKQMAAVVAARNMSPAYFTRRSLREALYGKDDPSLRDATPDSVRSVTLDDIRAYYKYAYRPDLTTIVVIGKITPAAARATIEKYFGTWTATGPKPPTDLPPQPPNRPDTVAVPDASRVQDLVIVAQNLALRRSDSDYYALELGSAVLGGGFYSTRLSIDLRKNAGLVYSVGSQLQAGKTRSAYLVQYACDPENVAKASAMVVRELLDMQMRPVSADELARVKALLLRQIPLGEASIDDIANGFISRRDLELPLDEPTHAARRYIELGPAEIQAAFKRWIRPNDLVRVSQGPAPK